MYVIIPSNDAARLGTSLAALRRAEPGVSIIVISDGFVAAGPGIDTVLNRGPFCFAAAINAGLARVPAAHEVVLMNDDAMLETPGGLQIMARVARELGCDLAVPACDCAQQAQVAALRSRYVGPTNDRVSFVCAWISPECRARIGPLDERFRWYGFEDDDYLIRMRRAGLRWCIVGSVIVRHRWAPSAYRGAPGAAPQPAMFEAARREFISKWGGWPW